MRIVITGGHHTSALPVIKKLKERHNDLEIFWLGHKHSAKGDKNPTLEYREITKLGIPFYNLHAGKLYKTYDPIRLIKVPFGVLQAFFLLLKIRPSLIFSFGGYLAAPVVLAGRILKIPSITHEQTVVTGHANKFISKYVKKIMITWPQSEKYFPKEKIVVTGLPLREEILEFKSNSFHSENDLPTVYVTAGKLGSNKINVAVEGCLPRLLSMCNVIHQAGDVSVYGDYDRLLSLYEKLNPKPKGDYYIRKYVFEDEIGEAYSKADLVISRSGAHTTLELIALKKTCDTYSNTVGVA